MIHKIHIMTGVENGSIILTLKKYPRLDIHSIALMLKIPSIVVSQAQHEHLKMHMKTYRESTAWEMRHYNKQKL